VSDGAGEWWAAGLRFECTRCGRCCTSGPDSSGYVWVEPDEAERMAAALGLSLAEMGSRYLRRVGTRLALTERAGGECVFLRDGACAVYDVRPRQCVAFPFWPRHLSSPQAWDEAAADCEGIGRDAPLVTSDAIARSRALFEGGITSTRAQSVPHAAARGAGEPHEA
jgi:Fe-S-cluster containining protein